MIMKSLVSFNARQEGCGLECSTTMYFIGPPAIWHNSAEYHYLAYRSWDSQAFLQGRGAVDSKHILNTWYSPTNTLNSTAWRPFIHSVQSVMSKTNRRRLDGRSGLYKLLYVSIWLRGVVYKLLAEDHRHFQETGDQQPGTSYLVTTMAKSLFVLCFLVLFVFAQAVEGQGPMDAAKISADTDADLEIDNVERHNHHCSHQCFDSYYAASRKCNSFYCRVEYTKKCYYFNNHSSYGYCCSSKLAPGRCYW